MKILSLDFEYDHSIFYDKSVPLEFIRRIKELTLNNPTKTNLKRKEFVDKIVSGMDCRDICESFKIKSAPHRYLCKILRRYCEYVGMNDIYISVRDLRKCK